MKLNEQHWRRHGDNLTIFSFTNRLQVMGVGFCLRNSLARSLSHPSVISIIKDSLRKIAPSNNLLPRDKYIRSRLRSEELFFHTFLNLFISLAPVSRTWMKELLVESLQEVIKAKRWIKSSAKFFVVVVRTAAESTRQAKPHRRMAKNIIPTWVNTRIM